MTNKETIAKTIELAEQYYGEGNVSYFPHNLVTHGDDMAYLTVFFPRLTIKNSYGHSHEILELYLQVMFEDECLVGKFKGMRTCFSREEYESGYIHSHLPTADRTEFSFSDFCMGEDYHLLETISYKMREARENGTGADNGVSEEELVAFVVSWEHFLQWESISGVPYIKIRNIKLSSSSFFKNFSHSTINSKKPVFKALVDTIVSETLSSERPWDWFRFEITKTGAPVVNMMPAVKERLLDGIFNMELYLETVNALGAYQKHNRDKQYILVDDLNGLETKEPLILQGPSVPVNTHFPPTPIKVLPFEGEVFGETPLFSTQIPEWVLMYTEQQVEKSIEQKIKEYEKHYIFEKESKALDNGGIVFEDTVFVQPGT